MSNKVYHYTTIEGLYGILKENEMWFSHIRFMNDESEFIGIFNTISELMAEKYAMKKTKRRFMLKPKTNNSMREHFFELSEKATLDGISDVIGDLDMFVGSFCKTGEDLLSQWRGYAKDTVGFSITFDSDELYNSSKLNTSLNTSFVDCIYKFEDMQKELNKISFKFMHDDPTTNHSGTIEGINLSARCKHPGFEEENEKRLLITVKESDEKALKFRKANGYLIPYISYNISPKAIKSIKIGPSKDQELVKLSLTKFLKSIGKNHIKIELSDTPYKN